MTEPIFGPNWRIAADRVARGGREGTLEATPEECARISAALGALSCQSFALSYVLTPRSRNRVHCEGRVHGSVTQACVVTLEPVPQTIDTKVVSTFLPSDALEKLLASDVAFDDAEFEAIVDGNCDLGQLAYENFALELEPYPRAPDADDGWDGRAVASDGVAGPFGVLQKLRTDVGGSSDT